MTTDTFERLRTILLRDYPLDAAALTPDAPLEALGIDSLGLAELLFNVEDEFAIRLPPEPPRLPTLADVVAFIDGLVARQHGGDGGAAAATATSTLPREDGASPPAALSDAEAPIADGTGVLPPPAPAPSPSPAAPPGAEASPAPRDAPAGAADPAAPSAGGAGVPPPPVPAATPSPAPAAPPRGGERAAR